MDLTFHRFIKNLGFVPMNHTNDEIPMDFKAFLTRCIIRLQRMIFVNNHGRGAFGRSPQGLDMDASIDLIAEKISGGCPFIAGKIGTGDCETIARYIDVHDPGSKFVKTIKMLIGERGPFWWDNSIRAGICVCAGVFPTDISYIEKFVGIFTGYCGEIDALPNWTEGESRIYRRFCPNATIIRLESLAPFRHNRSWIHALRGKKVLIVHPYVKTIRQQYEKHVEFQPGHGPMPEFASLQMYRPVNSIGGKCSEFATWDEALRHMIADIRKLDFDVALLGCGVYGMPLAVEIKRMGKVAIYTGGATQILFGIKGKRWDNQGIYNEHWIRPLPDDVPENMQLIENGTFL